MLPDSPGLRISVSRDNSDVYRFCRVPFGIVRSPFLLIATIKYHSKMVGNSIAVSIMDNIYVNNILLRANTAREAYKLYVQLKGIFAGLSMSLCEWIFNSEEFLKMLSGSEVVKVFGIQWDQGEDVLDVDFG